MQQALLVSGMILFQGTVQKYSNMEAGHYPLTGIACSTDETISASILSWFLPRRVEAQRARFFWDFYASTTVEVLPSCSSANVRVRF